VSNAKKRREKGPRGTPGALILRPTGNRGGTIRKGAFGMGKAVCSLHTLREVGDPGEMESYKEVYPKRPAIRWLLIGEVTSSPAIRKPVQKRQENPRH